MDDTNWDIYFICQVSSKDNVHSSTDGNDIITSDKTLLINIKL